MAKWFSRLLGGSHATAEPESRNRHVETDTWRKIPEVREVVRAVTWLSRGPSTRPARLAVA